MHLSHPEYDLLGENVGRVLGRLAVLPDGASGRRIHELSKIAGLRTTQRILERLVRVGLVNLQAVGNTHRYSLNRDHALWGPVEALLEMPAVLDQELMVLAADMLGPLVEHAILYGSFARDAADDSSDIDVLLIWRDESTPDDRAASVERAAAWVYARTGNRAQFLGLTQKELNALVAAGDPLVASLRSDGMPLTEDTDISRLLEAAR